MGGFWKKNRGIEPLEMDGTADSGARSWTTLIRYLRRIGLPLGIGVSPTEASSKRCFSHLKLHQSDWRSRLPGQSIKAVMFL